MTKSEKPVFKIKSRKVRHAGEAKVDPKHRQIHLAAERDRIRQYHKVSIENEVSPL